MNHHGIFFNTDAFSVAVVATADLLLFRVSRLENKKATEKLAIIIIKIYVLILGVSLKVYLSLQ
jgi:hypothetical protein